MTLYKGIPIKKASLLNLAEHAKIMIGINADIAENYF